MDALYDSSNIQRHDRVAKRPRLSQLEPAAASFATIVDRAGVQGLSDASSEGLTTAALPGIDDPRRVKRQLGEDLAKPQQQDTFLASMSEVIANDELLRRCLLPMEVTDERCLKYATGDSFMRLLLNILPLQQRLATMLLQKLPEFSTAECDEPDNAAADVSTASLSSLILAQLRWLEVVADAAALTATMLEVLPVCSPSIQRQLICILPEVAQPQDHSLVLEQLQGLLEADVTFMAPVVECLGNMMLEPALQDEVVSSLMSQLPAVEVEDLPGLVKYIISTAGTANAEQVLTTLRSNLHFINPADPRLAVPDHRQKGLMHPTSRSPEALLVRELVPALQGNPAAAAACLKLEASLTDPGAHGCFDLVVLLALHTKGSDSRKAVEACLKKKLLEGAATPAWLNRALTSHPACYRDQLWNSLLSLASSWCSVREAPVTAAASALYVTLFVVFDAALERQQVLHALHGHLGSGVSGQQDAALQALSTLASRHVGLLRGYSSYLANILDHLEGFSNTQLQQVFSMFAALTARTPAARAAAAAGASGSAGGSSAVTSAAGGSRLEDELVITLNKALAQSNPGYKRIGIMGMLALLQQEGATYELLCDAQGTAAGAVKDSWISRADSVFNQCMSSPGIFAFLLDQWSLLLEAQQQHPPQPPAAAAAGAGAGGAAVADGPTAPPQIPAPMLEWMHEKVNDLLVEVFAADMPGAVEASEVQEPLGTTQAQQLNLQTDDPHLKAQLWFNLDGSFAPVYLAVLPLVASRDTHKRTQLTWLPAALRLLAAIANCRFGGDLTNVDALLGCPLALPDRNMFANGQWDVLPVPSKVTVLLALQHTICWLREVVAVFGPSISIEALVATAGSENTQATMENLAATQNKLLMRLSQLRATEALYCDLVASCPAAAQQLPDLSYPLLTAAAGGGRAGLGSTTSSKAHAATTNPSAALALCRCLRPPAAVALNTCQPPHLIHTALLPATHLAADLHSKLKLLHGRARRPVGLMAPPAAPSGAGMGAGGVLPAIMASAGPPCLEGVALQQFVGQVVAPLLPALQQHLVMALNVIKQPPQGGLDTLFEGLPGYNQPGEAAMFELPAVQAVVAPVPAAHALALYCLQCFTLLLGCGRELRLQLMQAVLAALALQPAAAEAPTAMQIQQSLLGAFKACMKLPCRSSGNSNLQLELALMALLQALRGLAGDQGTPAEKVAAMSGKLSKVAAELLQETWEGPEEEAAEGDKGFSWKGQAAAISQLLGVLITHSSDPSAELLSLVNDALAAMPDKVPSKEQLDPVAGFAALCSATFITWYKVVFEQCCSCWERLNTRAMALLPSATGQGTAEGRKKKKKQEFQLDSQGRPDWDEEQVEEVFQQAHNCAQGFAGLVELTKKHKTRNQLLGTALKCGGAFIDVMVKATDFWYAYYLANGRPFQQLVKTVQKGTKTMQAICAEGKVRGGASVVAQAPTAKRALERFVHEMHSLFLQAGEPPEAITVGFLKHRDIEGNTMPSQLFPEPESEDDEEEEDEGMGAEDEGEEEEEEEGSVAGS